MRLDDRVVASYTDVNLDPEDLPKAVVNSFVFSPERLFVSAAEGVTVAPPELAAGQIRLPIVFPAELAGRRRLRLAYQVNDAGSAAPQWRDVVLALGEVVLAPGKDGGRPRRAGARDDGLREAPHAQRRDLPRDADARAAPLLDTPRRGS